MLVFEPDLNRFPPGPPPGDGAPPDPPGAPGTGGTPGTPPGGFGTGGALPFQVLLMYYKIVTII